MTERYYTELYITEWKDKDNVIIKSRRSFALQTARFLTRQKRLQKSVRSFFIKYSSEAYVTAGIALMMSTAFSAAITQERRMLLAEVNRC